LSGKISFKWKIALLAGVMVMGRINLLPDNPHSDTLVPSRTHLALSGLPRVRLVAKKSVRNFPKDGGYLSYIGDRGNLRFVDFAGNHDFSPTIGLLS
jgi:hypothetical protein